MLALKQRILSPRNYAIVLKFCIGFGCGFIGVLVQSTVGIRVVESLTTVFLFSYLLIYLEAFIFANILFQ